MTFRLQALLDLRRDAEENALRALETAASARVREQEEQSRLRARWREAQARLLAETRRLSMGDAPSTAEQATARELYLGRLRDDLAGAASLADEHRADALDRALAVEEAARTAYRDACNQRQAVERLAEQAREAELNAADRRTAETANDQAQAAYLRRKRE
jgi:hypothetical protein